MQSLAERDYFSDHSIYGTPAGILKLSARRGQSTVFGPGKRAEKTAAATGAYSTSATKIGVLLANPASKAVLDKHFPGVTGDARIGMAKTMTLRAVQKFAADMFTSEALAPWTRRWRNCRCNRPPHPIKASG
jgi:hypothetical protein